MKRAGILVAVLTVGSWTGCSQEGAAPPAPAMSSSNASSQSGQLAKPAASAAPEARSPEKLPADTEPNTVVGHFLEALRRGDEVTVADLLTRKAREETARHDLVVQPPGTESAQYDVGEVEFTDGNNGAYVSSTWTEVDRDGTEQAYEIVWVLRRQPDGWRVAGMATEVIPGDVPLFLNFEDPVDMLQKRRQADEALAAHQQGGTIRQAQATSPAAPETQAR